MRAYPEGPGGLVFFYDVDRIQDLIGGHVSSAQEEKKRDQMNNASPAATYHQSGGRAALTELVKNQRERDHLFVLKKNKTACWYIFQFFLSK